MTSYTEGGDIAPTFFSFELKKRSIKLTIEGTGYLYRKQIKDSFMQQFGLVDNDFSYIHKQERSREWYVTFRSETLAQQVLTNPLMTIDRCSVRLEDINKQRVVLKVHWLPVWIINNFLVEYFSQFGDVVSVDYIWSADAKVNTEMREVIMVVDDIGKNNIPHLVKFKGGTKMLVTCPGRMPICLKCNCLGHVRRDCAATVRNQSRTYADRLMNREFPTLLEAARATMPSNPVVPPPPPLPAAETTTAAVVEETHDEATVDVPLVTSDNTLPADTVPEFTPVENEEDLLLSHEEQMDATITSVKHHQEGEEQQHNKKKKKTTHQAPFPPMLGENSVFFTEDILSSPISPQIDLLDPGENT